MSRKPQSRNHSTPGSSRPQSSHGPAVGNPWKQMVLELIAVGDTRPADPTKLDDITIARYLSGECSSAERSQIERAIAKSPELSECITLAREALAKTDSAA
jgi:hypothetical protein